MQDNYNVEYFKDLGLFKVRIFDEVSETTVKSCFEAYEELVQKHFEGNPFKLMINNSGYTPATESAHRLIRQLFSNQTYKTKCIKVAIINENIPSIERRKELGVREIEGFFSSENEALKWLGNKK